ncbi:DNA cytosine methyltransferase [Brevibacterium aurantiacum]|uniref:DNA cytosine methyltransferase n=1 Tax=Brevibacterium aurantiacum TaxID=273384 RepID=UPI001866C60D|nr:DNA cytosine methyltransferase [Brevibacterium aurantiacum]
MAEGIVDLFSGVGGLSLGFEQAGYQIMAANEHDTEIADAFRTNHPKAKMYTDDLELIDLQSQFKTFRGETQVVIGGPPCQGFSQKGRRKSILDKRNFLFKEYVAAVDYLRPKYFVMENVPNLLTTEHGYFQYELKKAFDAIGYQIEAQILTASDYGVPQRRRRAVILGKLGAKPPLHPQPSEETVTVWDAISDLAYHASGEGSDVEQYRTKARTSYQTLLRTGSGNLHNHKATNHSDLALHRMNLMPLNSKLKSLPQEHRTKSIYAGTWTRLVKEETAPTITTRFDTPSSGQFTHPVMDRAITVREAARLQSFPDTFRFTGTKGSQMKQVGNAVPPRLAYAIAMAISQDKD